MSDLERRDTRGQNFHADLRSYARTVWHRTTKFGSVTRVGVGVFLRRVPRPHLKGAGPHWVPKTTKFGIIHVGERRVILVLSHRLCCQLRSQTKQHVVGFTCQTERRPSQEIGSDKIVHGKKWERTRYKWERWWKSKDGTVDTKVTDVYGTGLMGRLSIISLPSGDLMLHTKRLRFTAAYGIHPGRASTHLQNTDPQHECVLDSTVGEDDLSIICVQA